MQFTGFGNSIPDGEQFSQETRVPVLTLEGKCLRRRAKPAHLVRHLPAPPNWSHFFTTPTRFSGLMQPFDHHGATLLKQPSRQASSAGSGEKEPTQKALEAAAEYPDGVELD